MTNLSWPHHLAKRSSLTVLVLVSACSSPATPTAQDSTVLDSDVGTPDTAVDGIPPDSQTRDISTNDANSYGFVVYEPSTVELNTARGPREFPTKSFGCTLRTRGNDAVIYIHATPTGVLEGGLEPSPVFASVNAWMYDRRTSMTRPVTATYDWGGGHQNDHFVVTLDGIEYRYYHSSFGFGWRKCHPADCVQIRENGNVVDDGCTPARTHPEICRELDSSTFPALDTDTFARCLGDPNGQ